MRKLYSGIVAVIFALAFPLTSLADSINWQPYSKATFERAAKEHKNVLLFGKAVGCHWCQKTKDEVLTDPSVISTINSKYIPVKLDVDENLQVAQNFGITSFPTFIILSPSQTEVRRHSGFLTSDELMGLLK